MNKKVHYSILHKIKDLTKYFLEDKNLIEKYIEIIKASNNHNWVDDSFMAFIIEQIEISEQVDREIEERRRKQRH